MKISLNANIHNTFEIVVRDIVSDAIVQKGYAENIILDSLWNSASFCATANYVGQQICFGTGSGEISSSNTALFNKTGCKFSTLVDYDFNDAPGTSWATHKIVINPGEYTGITITEVGVGDGGGGGTVYTHALINDSTGKALSVGPLEENQEVTIYRTTYFQPNIEAGISLRGYNYGPTDAFRANGLICGATMSKHSGLKNTADGALYMNVFISGAGDRKNFYFGDISNKKMTSNLVKYLVSEINQKIKTIYIGHIGGSSGTAMAHNFLDINLETLAENNSNLWKGHEFDHIPIGVGDGTTKVFPLIWDEVWMTKAKKVYVDGVENSNVTWSTNSIAFDIAPASGDITTDYWVKYAPKDTDHEFWVQIEIIFNEGVAS